MFGRRLKPLGEGIHTLEGEGPFKGVRFQFRVDDGGAGLCIVDASRIIHLNDSGLQFARLAVLDLPPKKAAGHLKFMFRAKPRKLREDYAGFQERFRPMVMESPSAEMFLDVEPKDLFRDTLPAPYRADLAVTYECDNCCPHCYVEESRRGEGGGGKGDRVKDGNKRKGKGIKEPLDTAGVKSIIDRLVDAGIPHIIFTGGEATLRDDLPELIRYANDKSLVTGLNSNGRRLADRAYAKKLMEAGLDHAQVTLLSADPAIHDEMCGAKAFSETVEGIRNLVRLKVPVMTNTTLTTRNYKGAEKLVAFLEELGLTKFAVNGIIRSGGGKGNPDALDPGTMEKVLKKVRTAARVNELVMIWYSPTRYCDLNPITLGLGLKRCTAAHLSVCIEPDGDVLPCQSYFRPIGNILKDDWKAIWEHPLAKKLRNNRFAPRACRECEWWTACAGGCALEYEDETSPVCRGVG